MTDSKSVEELQEAIIQYTLPDFYNNLDETNKAIIRQSILDDDKFKSLVELFDQELEKRVAEGEQAGRNAAWSFTYRFLYPQAKDLCNEWDAEYTKWESAITNQPPKAQS